MERLKKILEEIKPDIDYDKCENLIDGHFLDSLSILALIAELEDEFDITIPAIEIIPSNFNSMVSIWNLIQKIIEEN